MLFERTLRAAALVTATAAFALTSGAALAQKKYDTGASDTEIKVGNIMTVLENVAIGAHLRGHSGPISSMLRLDRADEAKLLAEAARQIERVGLADQMHQLAGSLSLGQQRIVEIARALCVDPMLLLLDEPAAGLRHMLLGILIFWGIAATSYRGTHITVDLVWGNVGPRYQRWIDVFATLVLLFVVTVQTWTLFDKVRGTYNDNVQTFDMKSKGVKTLGYIGYSDSYGDLWFNDLKAQAVPMGMRGANVSTTKVSRLLVLDLVDFRVLMARHPDLAETIDAEAKRRALENK